MTNPLIKREWAHIDFFHCFLVYGNDVMGEFGQIASPLYPRTYPNNAHYHWTITVDGDSYIQIRFLEMDIEDLYDCFYDQLKVRCVWNHSVSLI